MLSLLEIVNMCVFSLVWLSSTLITVILMLMIRHYSHRQRENSYHVTLIAPSLSHSLHSNDPELLHRLRIQTLPPIPSSSF